MIFVCFFFENSVVMEEGDDDDEDDEPITDSKNDNDVIFNKKHDSKINVFGLIFVKSLMF